MNANNATTNAQTTNAYVPRVMIMTFGRHTSTVNYTDIKKVRAYMKKKTTQGFSIDSVYGMGSDAVLITLTKGNRVSFTPGFQYAHVYDNYIYAYGTKNANKNWSGQISIPEPEPTPVKYGVRSIKDGVVLEWETFATIEDARGYAEDDIEEGATESVIIAVNRDGSLGDVVETIRPEPEPTPTIDHYRIRTVVKGVIVDGTNEPTELDARTTAQQIVDADPTGATEAWIIPVMTDRTLNGVLAVIRYIDPSEDTDWMFPDDDDDDDDEPEPVHDEPIPTLNAVTECANICPTAIDAVKVAMTLDAPISIRTGIKSFEIVPNGNGSASGRIIYHGTYAHGGIDLGTLNAVDIREHGVALQYIEEDGTPDEFFIQAVTIKSITALNTGRDIFVRGAN